MNVPEIKGWKVESTIQFCVVDQTKEKYIRWYATMGMETMANGFHFGQTNYKIFGMFGQREHAAHDKSVTGQHGRRTSTQGTQNQLFICKVDQKWAMMIYFI